MPPVPSVWGERLVRALERAGFKVARVAGSHHVMRHPDGRGTTVPVHAGKDVAKGTLRNILADTRPAIDDREIVDRQRQRASYPAHHKAEMIMELVGVRFAMQAGGDVSSEGRLVRTLLRPPQPVTRTRYRRAGP
jgi:predicted RNA binding protein YcfA (HicA-like mRNA interferase family)